MPVVNLNKGPMKKEKGNSPEWCKASSVGVARIAAEGGKFSSHYHDTNEYWLIYKGKAKVRSEGKEYYVQSGDIVCTHAGDEHDILEVYEDLELFYFIDELPEGGRTAHQHSTPDGKPVHHPVGPLPLPADFPAKA